MRLRFGWREVCGTLQAETVSLKPLIISTSCRLAPKEFGIRAAGIGMEYFSFSYQGRKFEVKGSLYSSNELKRLREHTERARANSLVEISRIMDPYGVHCEVTHPLRQNHPSFTICPPLAGAITSWSTCL